MNLKNCFNNLDLLIHLWIVKLFWNHGPNLDTYRNGDCIQPHVESWGDCNREANHKKTIIKFEIANLSIYTYI